VATVKKPHITNPDHYHNITKVTAKYAALVQAEQAVATRTPAELAGAAREQHGQEVHVTGKTNQPESR
jgi:hypothetical protein